MSHNAKNNPPESTAEKCTDCGAPVAGGRAGCQALFTQLGANSFQDAAQAAVHDLFVDAYCMQHPEPYCHSAKSHAAHLTRLCCGIEHAGNRNVYAAIQKWLNGKGELRKPEVLSLRGRMNVADLRLALNSEEFAGIVREWARNVWEAYAVQHDIARNWIQAALGEREPALPRKDLRRR